MAYTRRRAAIRLISARKANARETQKYHAFFDLTGSAADTSREAHTQIEARPIDYSDIPELSDDFWT